MDKKELIIKNDFDRNSLANIINSLDLSTPKKIVIEDSKNTRSLAQNSLLWLWNGEIQRFMSEHSGVNASAYDWHDTMVERLCPPKVEQKKLPNGEVLTVVKRQRTSKFNIQQMTDYLEKLDAYCASSLGLLLPHPNDLMDAIYGRRVA